TGAGTGDHREAILEFSIFHLHLRCRHFAEPQAALPPWKGSSFYQREARGREGLGSAVSPDGRRPAPSPASVRSARHKAPTRRPNKPLPAKANPAARGSRGTLGTAPPG